MDKELLHQLETPCVVLDTRMAEENIKKMQAACDACGVKLRPHIKTHKMPLFAKMQRRDLCQGWRGRGHG